MQSDIKISKEKIKMNINPGSENKGGTFKQALINANEWLEEINEQFPEVTMTTHEDRCGENGNWNFTFMHMVTKKEIILEIHGFTKDECDAFVFHPRVYWDGSSTADPEIKDWLTDEYKHRVVYERKV